MRFRGCGGHRIAQDRNCPVGAGLLARPFSIFGAIPTNAPPICTLCHGWPEPGAAGKSHRPKYFAAPGPSAPGGMKPGTVFCAPEILRKGVGVSPVDGGPGVERLWAGTPIGAHPRRRFASFAAAGKGGRPAGRDPLRRRDLSASWSAEDGRVWDPPLRRSTAIPETWREGQAPPLRMDGETSTGGERAGGSGTRPYGDPRPFPRHGGRGKPLPYGVAGKHFPAENGRAAAEGRPCGVSFSS